MALYDTDDIGLRQHHGNVTQLDHAFGKLMAALDGLGVADDTNDQLLQNSCGR